MIDCPQQLTIPYGAWNPTERLNLSFPENWKVNMMALADGVEVNNDQIISALDDPIGASRLEELAVGKRTVAIAVDDITRPTPLGRILPEVIERLIQGGIEKSNISIIIGVGAHRPMTSSEITDKLSSEIVENCKVYMHDFMGKDVANVGWIGGGPVYINSHFMEADIKLCVSGVMPHGETGFGGGAKMIIPGIAGHLSIAHLHGALPARNHGEIEATGKDIDRRSWSEQVARTIGVDAIVCSVVNSQRKIAGLFYGDVVGAHRVAAKFAAKLGETIVSRDLGQKADIVILNSYPLDTDPIQMGKCLNIAKKLSAKHIILINSATDAIFYHGMGMGSGIDIKRLLRNFPRWILSPARLYCWLRSLGVAIKSPLQTLRLCYFSLNNLSFTDFNFLYKKMKKEDVLRNSVNLKSDLSVYSPNFPAWGFARRYPKGQLYNNWETLIDNLSQRLPDSPNILLFPCAPLQLVKL